MTSQKNKRKKHIVVIGGGTGQGNLLRGLKKLENIDLTAIVTVADDGGGSGTIRQEMRMLPPGDIRSCLISLSNMDPTMEKLMTHRFIYGSLKGQSFGNLFILALNEIFGDFEVAIDQVSEMISVKGTVLPASLEPLRLMATLENDNVVIGESNISKTCIDQNTHLKKMELIPERPLATDKVKTKIEAADVIVIGPGSLYTSLVPNLLIPEIRESIQKNTKAHKIYACNLMTEMGETQHLNIVDHVKEIVKYLGVRVDYVLLNDTKISDFIVDNYRKEEKEILLPTTNDIRQINELGIQTIVGDFIKETDYGALMHDSEKMARIIPKL